MAVVKMSHLRSLGYCSSGVREFFNKHGLDFCEFLKNGIDENTLLGVCPDDHMVQQALEKAHGK